MSTDLILGVTLGMIVGTACAVIAWWLPLVAFAVFIVWRRHIIRRERRRSFGL